MYLGDPLTPYEDAQQNQAEALLNACHCQAGSRLLDVGCGYGRVLAAAQARGAEAMGITISAPQVDHCRQRGLAAQVMDYRELPGQLLSRFDCLVANGSLEHFVQIEDAAAGRADAIYRQMFGIFREALDAESESGRCVTTAIHFGHFYQDPREFFRRRHEFRRGSPEHHYAQLVGSFGGYYPMPGQLERCAAGLFELETEQDGTEDYYWTSEEWLGRLRRALATNPRFMRGVAVKLCRHPRPAAALLDCLIVNESWNWQFRGEDPPMRLYRHTWRRVG